MNGLLRIGLTMTVAYGAVVAAAYVAQRRLLYFPDTRVIDPAATRVPDMAAHWLEAADGTRVVAWYKAAPEGRPTIVMFHGNAGNLAHRDLKARFFLDRGYGVLMAGYRGYGGSEGRPDEAGLIADGRAAMAFLDQQGIPGERLVLFAESLGTGIAVRIAAERAVAALVLEAPYSSITDVAARAYPYLPVRSLIKDRFASIEHIGRVTAPLLVVHGARDRVIPPDIGRRLFDAANQPKQAVLIDGAGHNDVFEAGGRLAAIEFLDQLFGPMPSP